MAAFLPSAGFILEPDPDRLTGQNRAAQKDFLYQAGEVFLKASWAASSFSGWNGRGCSRVRPGLRSHLPMAVFHGFERTTASIYMVDTGAQRYSLECTKNSLCPCVSVVKLSRTVVQKECRAKGLLIRVRTVPVFRTNGV